MRSILGKIFGTTQSRAIAKYRKQVAQINSLEEKYSDISDEQLIEQTQELRNRAKEGEKPESLINECFALVREAAKRSLSMRHFDVQIIGGLVLNDGKIAEMKTGEGKTLVATLPATFNAILGHPVHIVTVNDYLAKRDAEWMAKVYEKLGLSVGCIHNELSDQERKDAYACEITYATNNELGFDYLRDNMKTDFSQMVQRGHGFAIVDEVDSILIDEARTPLIISGQVADQSNLYEAINLIVPKLEEKHYEIDEKQKGVHFTEEGSDYTEELLKEAGIIKEGGLFDAQNVTILHHCNCALKAHTLFARDKDYIVKDDSIVIIDEFTGRMMPGRRYSEGLHQALEAKEKVTIQPENQTLASITFQNYFRMYKNLSGMTGTALTEAEEFAEIYKLEVAEIPTNVIVTRRDEDDEIYRTAKEKFQAVVDLVAECHEQGQPVLVGTTSIEKSEMLSAMIKQKNIPHNVLNARFHEQEANIIALAGMPGAITIATNMAGRGTDIKLGGNAEIRILQECGNMPEGDAKNKQIERIENEIIDQREKALAAGGLYVIGTERHESRRIDNQLRGRSGRQGDPGVSRFFLSLEDDLMRIFGSDRLDSMLGKLGLAEGESIVHPWVTKALETAQKKVEAHHFNVRKNILKFDDVMSHQRAVIFEQRLEYMRSDDLSENIDEMREEVVIELVEQYIAADTYPEAWKTTELSDALAEVFGLRLPIESWAAEEGIDGSDILDRTQEAVSLYMKQKEESVGSEIFRRIEKMALLQCLDTLWRDHLQFMENLRQVIGLRGYGQRDPLNEYKTESFNEFQIMLSRLREKVVKILALAQFTVQQQPQQPQQSQAIPNTTADVTGDLPPPQDSSIEVMSMDEFRQQDSQASLLQDENELSNPEQSKEDRIISGKIPRNAPCLCGSGSKYKNCCGKNI